MPCYVPDPTPEEIEESQRQSNEKKYGFHLSNHELIAHLLNMCCEMGNAIHKVNKTPHWEVEQAYNAWQYVSQETYNWFLEHQERDNEIKKRDLTNRLSLATTKYTTIHSNLEEIDKEIENIKNALLELN